MKVLNRNHLRTLNDNCKIMGNEMRTQETTYFSAGMSYYYMGRRNIDKDDSSFR